MNDIIDDNIYISEINDKNRFVTNQTAYLLI